jgi:hypothetical protein
LMLQGYNESRFANSTVVIMTLFAITNYHWHICWKTCFLQFVGCDRSAEDDYSSAAPDPTFAFSGGPCCTTLDIVIAFWIMIMFYTLVTSLFCRGITMYMNSNKVIVMNSHFMSDKWPYCQVDVLITIIERTYHESMRESSKPMDMYNLYTKSCSVLVFFI